MPLPVYRSGHFRHFNCRKEDHMQVFRAFPYPERSAGQMLHTLRRASWRGARRIAPKQHAEHSHSYECRDMGPPCQARFRCSENSSVAQESILPNHQPNRARLTVWRKSSPFISTRTHISARRERIRSPIRSPRVGSAAARAASFLAPPLALPPADKSA